LRRATIANRAAEPLVIMSLGPNPHADLFNKTWENEVFRQPFNLTNAYGEVVTFDLGILDSFMRYIGETLIVCGIAFGMCFVLIIVLLLLTKPEKRRTPVFIFNLVSLVLMVLRMLCMCIQQNGPLANLSSSLLFTKLIPASFIANQTLYAIFTALWYAITLVSMILQVRVVFSAEPKLQNVVTGSLSLLALATMGTILPPDIETIITTQNLTFILPPWYQALQHAANVTWVVTIGCSSLVFVAKLLYIIARRKKMGFKGFGPLQVITIMAAQCLVVPCTDTPFNM
jgi:pheromone alpha factor receptor